MRFGIYTPCYGDYADPRGMVELAQAAEQAGWDGVFVSDHLQWLAPEPQPVADPWIVLAAMATATQQVRLGVLVTPIARRRPWKLAREAATLDHLSGGRLVLGAGVGGDWIGEYSGFGEPADDRLHGEQLDEGLEVLAGLWGGAPFRFSGTHYQIAETQFLPAPIPAAAYPDLGWRRLAAPASDRSRGALGWDRAVRPWRPAHARGYSRAGRGDWPGARRGSSLRDRVLRQRHGGGCSG